MKVMRKTKIPGWYEFYRVACPVCGKTGGCMQHKSGDKVACIRVASKYYFSKDSALPSYLHFLNGDQKRKAIKESDIAEYKSEKKQKDSYLNIVYKAMIQSLGLDDSHYNHLRIKRGLTDEQIRIREYRSFPQRSWEVVHKIKEITGIDDFSGFPGFYLVNGQYGKFWAINGQNGILLPYRNNKNEIIGFQYRIENPPNDVDIKEFMNSGLRAKVVSQPHTVAFYYQGELLFEQELALYQTVKVFKHGINVKSASTDDLLGWVTLKKGKRYFWLSSANKLKGTSAGNPVPVHVSIPTSKLKDWKTGIPLKAKKIWLSEGPLKTDIASDLVNKLLEPEEIARYGDVFLALPGVNSWRLVLPILKEMEVEEINMCFDADILNNIYVKKILFDSTKEFKQQGYKVNIVMWEEKYGKGIDDILLNNVIPQFIPL